MNVVPRFVVDCLEFCLLNCKACIGHNQFMHKLCHVPCNAFTIMFLWACWELRLQKVKEVFHFFRIICWMLKLQQMQNCGKWHPFTLNLLNVIQPFVTYYIMISHPCITTNSLSFFTCWLLTLRYNSITSPRHALLRFDNLHGFVSHHTLALIQRLYKFCNKLGHVPIRPHNYFDPRKIWLPKNFEKPYWSPTFFHLVC
jgi:hypothetical protein